MWITPSSIRSAFSLESGCSTKDCMPDLDSWASEAERSCTLNGKLTQSASWKRGWKKEAYLQRLSGGAICANSTQASFAAWWIASLRASRVKTSVSPDGGPGLTANEAACSLKSSGLPVIAVRDTGKAIFGGGVIMSAAKAAELKAAELKAAVESTEWALSARERGIVARLGASGARPVEPLLQAGLFADVVHG